MRVIDFRVWDKEAREFVYFHLKLGEEIFIDPSIYDDNIYLCTGLKDKKGRSIYEGDIVRYRCLICVDKDLEQTYDEVIGIVEYRGSCFTAGMQQGHYSNYLLYELDKYEVIGNVCENPELLEMEVK